MNSIRNVQRAIEYEMKRQIEIVENGGAISQETRSFDAANGTTFLCAARSWRMIIDIFPNPIFFLFS